jgi:ribonuclease D
MLLDRLSEILRWNFSWFTTRMAVTPSALSKAGDALEKPTRWPLSFRMRSPQILEKAPQGRPRAADSQKPYWSHLFYCGPNMQPVKIDYCKSRTTSEIIAQKFLNEEVLGFDMEWESDTGPLQQRISVIQIASESQIALFHIGLHVGSTPEELIAPSLRKIIESPNITKTGVSINYADGKRLREYFGLQPRGLFELSYLYRLVKYAATSPSQVNKGLVALRKQVEEHLHLPLLKDKVRVSKWSKPLNQKQIQYAANDAYAGFMLYHCMEAKRTRMDPIPPRPAHAELYRPIQLRQVNIEKSLDKSQVERENAGSKPHENQIQANEYEPALDPVSAELFADLCQRRVELATRHNVEYHKIAIDHTLKRIAQLRPQRLEDLRKSTATNPHQPFGYAAEWLAVVHKFTAAQLPSPGLPAQQMVSLPVVNQGILSSSTRVPPLQHRQRTALRPINPPNSLAAAPQLTAPDLGTLSPSSRRLSSALTALRARLSHTLGKPVDSIASHMVIRTLVMSPPQSVEELRKVAGITSLTQATEQAGIDLLKFIAKYAPVKKAVAPKEVKYTNLTGEDVAMADSFEGGLVRTRLSLRDWRFRSLVRDFAMVPR